MKKLLLVLFGIWILSPSFSQNENRSHAYDLGVFIGPGYSSIMGGDSWKGAFGLIIGVDSKVKALSEKSSIKAGIGVSIQGAAYDEGVYMVPGYEGYSGKGNVNLSYIFIPLLYHYVFGSGLYAEAGLQPGFLLSAKDKYDGGSYDYKDSMKKFDLGLPVGAGYQLSKKLSIGARATFGLTNLDDTGSDTSDHNFMLVAVLRYAFGSSD
jgi:hypothetical protein